ncbi:MAG: tetratricopeptide repeat protein, partial [Candidatus Hodarchaeota archaeon]
MDLTILAVHWDDISGPSVISIFPSTVLTDPESVALQIYLASVTVFGQHGHSQRTEFSVPLLSLGKDVIARVAFDSWPDPTLRGKERLFFLAFLLDQSTADMLAPHLDTYIFDYLDEVKVQKSDFSGKSIWEKIAEKFSSPVEKESSTISFDVDSEYSIPKALQDLNVAKNAWDNLKDRNQLWKALRVANRLEHVNDRAAGDAFTLVGQIFLDSNNFQEAGQALEKATDAYVRGRLFEKAGEASCLAGKCLYHLREHEKAIDLLQAGARWVKDASQNASLNYDMGIVFHEQSSFEEANACFEKAVKIAAEVNKSLAAEYSSTYASKLIFQADKERKNNPTYALGLIRRSAEQRENASHFLQLLDERKTDAATSLILAANAYFSLGNTKKGISLLENTSSLFFESKNYISAARSLYDGARYVKDQTESLKLLKRAITILDNQENGIQKSRLLGLILFEKAKIEVKKEHLTAALESYKTSILNLKEADAPSSDLIPVQIQYANNLFKLELFEEAAEIFFAGYKGISNLPPTEKTIQQREKTKLNALISLRRASTIYHNAGVIALKNNEERRAIEMFVQSISLLIEWVENNTKDDKEEIMRVAEGRISTLKPKIDLLVLAESKYKLESLVESLRMSLPSLEE